MSKLAGMQLVFHGGKCCGIKTVYQMDTDPESKHNSLDKIPQNNGDQSYHDVGSDKRFFHLDAPYESGYDRLKRYIEYMEKYRPRNILEVVIIKSPKYSWQDQSKWIPVLEGFGFTQVNEHTNSNSGNIVCVFHLNVDAVPEAKPTAVIVEEDEDGDFDD